MSFLDRFKPQPRWKHTDPAIRAAAVPEIPDDPEHRGAIEELAMGDEDARVRSAAIARVVDVPLLARLARWERDPDLRRQVTERLVAVATAPSDTDGDAALALEGLDDPRHFSTIAKSSPHETIRTAALARVHDVKALGSIARHAADPQTALDAVARIADPAELLSVALKTDHKEAALAAVERSVDISSPDARDTLEALVGRARNRAVAKRARAMVQAIDDADAARRAAFEEWHRRLAGILSRVEAIADAPSLPGAGTGLADAEMEWRDISSNPAFEPDQDTAARFGALVEAARGAVAAYEQQEAERRAMAERDALLRATRSCRS